MILDLRDLIGGSCDRFAGFDRGPRVELKRTIQQFTESGQVDCVVIGNNCGTGLGLAEAVDPQLRASHACVVWNTYSLGLEAPYFRLGYRTFLSRAEMFQELIQQLASEAMTRAEMFQESIRQLASKAMHQTGEAGH